MKTGLLQQSSARSGRQFERRIRKNGRGNMLWPAYFIHFRRGATERMKRKRASRRRVFWVWKSHLKEGSALYLWAKRHKDDKGRAVRVRITIL